MTTEVRVALLGYGLAGACFHAPTIAATPGLRLRTIVTASPERRARALREHPGVQVLDRADALFADPSGHDLVVVATPNSTHVPLTLAALAAGLAVVVDKPLAPTAEEARARRRRGAAPRSLAQRVSPAALGRGRPDPAAPHRARARWATCCGSSPASSAGAPCRRGAGARATRPATRAGSCTTWAAISSTRRCTCSGRWRACTRSSTGGGPASPSTTTCSWRSRMSPACARTSGRAPWPGSPVRACACWARAPRT